MLTMAVKGISSLRWVGGMPGTLGLGIRLALELGKGWGKGMGGEKEVCSEKGIRTASQWARRGST